MTLRRFVKRNSDERHDVDNTGLANQRVAMEGLLSISGRKSTQMTCSTERRFLSFYFLLVLFPLLLFLTALLGSFADAGTELRHNLLTYLRAIVPVSASDLINTTVEEISQKSSGGKLSFGLLTSLWFASSGMGAIIEGLNVAYDVKETRAWWRRTLLAILLTIALAVLIITALALMFYGSRIAEGIANRYGFGAAFTAVWTVLQWLFVLGFVFLAFGYCQVNQQMVQDSGGCSIIS